MPKELPLPLQGVQIRAMTRSLQTRLVVLLQQDHASADDWRRLQLEAIGEYLEGQRRFLALHTELLAVLTSDRDLHRRQRHEARELFLALSELHDVVHAIGRCLADSRGKSPHETL